MTKDVQGRRQLIAGLGTTAAAVALGTAKSTAQTSAGAFQPARHSVDDWLAERPAKHRVIMDVTSPDRMPDAIRFAGNLFSGSKSAYAIEESDLTIVMCLRHAATVFGYTDAMWSKYGKLLLPQPSGSNAGPSAPPVTNPFNSGDRMDLSNLATRGVRYMVCATASRGVARRIAGQGGDPDAIFKEIEASIIPSGRLVAAGVVAVTHAQEYGYSYLHVG